MCLSNPFLKMKRWRRRLIPAIDMIDHSLSLIFHWLDFQNLHKKTTYPAEKKIQDKWSFLR